MTLREADPTIEVEVDELRRTLGRDQLFRPVVLPAGLLHPGDHTSEPKSVGVPACAVACFAPFLLRPSNACAPDPRSQFPRTDGAALRATEFLAMARPETPGCPQCPVGSKLASVSERGHSECGSVSVAWISDIGPREENQDQAVAFSHDDGSWTIAVAHVDIAEPTSGPRDV